MGLEKSCMFEQFHAEPMKVYSNQKDRESQGHQKAIIPIIRQETKLENDEE